MYKQTITLGVAPTKRSFLSMEEAKYQKDKFMKVIRSIRPDVVKIVDIDDICENGIMSRLDKAGEIIEKFKNNNIDALFIPHCDFGEEQIVAAVASAFKLPTLIWGPRDERPNTDESRGRDTQCGMFASTKVLRRFGVKYSYIFNCETENPVFSEGYETFIRAAAVVKTMKGLKVAKIGDRPVSFMSVMTNEAALISKFGITAIPISPVAISKEAEKIIEENGADFQSYYKDVTSRMDCSSMKEEDVKKVAAIKMATKDLMLKNGCTVAAMECWSAFYGLLGVAPCMTLGEMSDEGYPISCETDLAGAVTLAIMRAASLGDSAQFFADLTIRHPKNDNAELLWHCGPFPYSLKSESCKARLDASNERWELKKGDITVARFDEVDGKYYLFAGEGRAVDGPETTGTYVWFETDDWKRWEEKLMFGPYIHHVGGMYGKYTKALREAARYLDIEFDTVDNKGPYSL